MEVKHDTPFESSLDAILDKDGSEARVAVMKATYDLLDDGSLRISEKQDPVYPQDTYLGQPTTSSVTYESDGAFFKPGTDCVIVGSVFSPTGKAVPRLDVGIQVASSRYEVAVIGDRVWNYGAFGVGMSSPKPFTEMPICWERSFGGIDALDADPQKHAWEPRNPIGAGFRITKSREALDGLPLPNFENPRSLIRSWDDKPSPHGLGYVGRSWMPRIRFAGTFDDRWQRQRMPILPVDFDYRFFNAAPQELVLPKHLEGGEAVRLVNLTKHGLDGFAIPKMRVVFKGYARRRRFALPARLDTLQVKTIERQIVMVWRTKYAVLLNEPADGVSADIEYFD